MSSDGMKLREGMTVVIPVYNRADIVRRTLDSIAAQTRFPDEVILVDNASTDNSLSVLESWRDEMSARGRKVTVLSESRPGGASARQAGFERVMTDKVMFFDSDDVMRPGHVAEAIRLFAETPGSDIVAWTTLTHFPEGGTRYKPVLARHLMEGHLLHAMLATQAYAVRTDFFRRAGGWDVTLHGWDDLEVGFRLLLNNPKIILSEQCNVDIYPQGEASITGVDYTHRRGEWENVISIMEENARRSGRKDTPHLLRLLAYRRAILAALYAREGNKDAARHQLSEALRSKHLNIFQKIYLRSAYTVTARGLRGAARPAPYLL